MERVTTNDLSVLLIEPSDMQQKLLQRNFNSTGIKKIECVSNMEESKAFLSTHMPDLIISAMYYKDGTAEDLLNYIRHNQELSHLPFMLVSSERKKEYLEALRQAGVVAILPKPFNPQDLNRAIRNALDYMTEEELSLELFDITEVRVLLVDDSKMARKHIRRVLENLGIQHLTEAENGAQAIDFLGDNMFDLVVTDYNMPEVDGRELAEHIRNKSQQSHLPILMVSSEANETHLSNIAQAGVDALCDKPFETATVRSLLYRLLEQ